jgi:hypothetical protein
MDEKRWHFGLRHLFTALAIVGAVLLNLRALRGVYETYGGVGGVGSYFLSILVVLCTALFGSIRRLRKISVVVLLVFCLCLSYMQLTPMRRLTLLNVEVPRIVRYVEDYNTSHGEYPNSLDEYVFENPEISSFVRYDKPGFGYGSGDPYSIYYHPIHTEGIGHWYGKKLGYYYEDD